MDRPTLKRSGSESSPDASFDGNNAAPSYERTDYKDTSFYREPRYAILLEIKRSFMKDSQQGMALSEEELCNALLSTPQSTPVGTLLDDAFIHQVCENLRNRNKTRVVRDLALLITPSVEQLVIRGLTALDHLAEGTSIEWDKCVPFLGPAPQPDYSVGFQSSAFSKDQLEKLKGLKAGLEETHFAATDEIYFPFLTTQVVPSGFLREADRRNAHSMTVAVRGAVELYRTAKREHEIHGKILAFSVSHDCSRVLVHAHYSEIDGSETKYYRHPIIDDWLDDRDGKDRWAAYRFVLNVYESFAPMHLNRIKSAVDDLPDPTSQP